MGSNKCTIPVDTIRDACEWFGVLFNLENEQLLLCRREPGSKKSTGDMYLERGNNIAIPDEITSNITLEAVKNLLNELFSISFLDLELTSNNFTSRPSYRDFMAFLFQPQNIVANADVMFYKADTNEHRQKLINIFPYALGAVTAKTLAAKQELERTQKEFERIQRDLRNIKDVAENWKSEVKAWLSSAYEYGLTSYRVNEKDKFEEQLNQLIIIASKDVDDSNILSTNIKDSSEELINLRKEEQEVSSQLFATQKRYTEMKQLMASVNQYDDSLQVQLNRLEISVWLRNMMKKECMCPLCGGFYSKSSEIIDELCNAIVEIEKTSAKSRRFT